MRTENEIYDLILKIAKSDTRIKAVYMMSRPRFCIRKNAYTK